MFVNEDQAVVLAVSDPFELGPSGNRFSTRELRTFLHRPYPLHDAFFVGQPEDVERVRGIPRFPLRPYSFQARGDAVMRSEEFMPLPEGQGILSLACREPIAVNWRTFTWEDPITISLTPIASGCPVMQFGFWCFAPHDWREKLEAE